MFQQNDSRRSAQENSRRPTQSKAAAKPVEIPSQITRETIQISLVRSFTSEATSGDKTCATTSSGKTGTQSASKESVKDSTSSYSSSDNEPISSTQSDEESWEEEEESSYSDESAQFEETQSTLASPQSQGVSTFSYKTTKETLDATESVTTNQSEMPKHRSQQIRRLSSVQNEPSTLTSEKTTQITLAETSCGITNTGSTSQSSSYSSKSSTSNQDRTSSAFNDDNTETINGVEYIRAHLTLPNTNEVISILMKKDENLGQILGLSQRRKHDSASERSNQHEKRKHKVDEEHPEKLKTRRSDFDSSKTLQPTSEESREIGSTLQKFGPSKHFSKLISKSRDSENKNSCTENVKQETEPQIKLNTNNLIPASRREEKYKLGIKEFSALETKKAENVTPSFRGGNLKKLGRYYSHQPISFNLPTLPKLDKKSVSFRINSEIIKARKSKAKSNVSFKKLRGYSLIRIAKERNLRRIHNHSSLRCPKFIMFDPFENTKEVKETQSSKKTVKKEIEFKKKFQSDMNPSMKSKRLHKASSPMTIIHSQEDLVDINSVTSSPEVTCLVADADRSILNLPGQSERAMISKNKDKTMYDPVSQDKPSALVLNKLGCGSLQASIERQIQRRLHQKSLKNQVQIRNKKPRYVYENIISPSGITKNNVRLYESNRLPEAISTKYKFQLIRNKFESASPRKKSSKKTIMNSIPLNLNNISKHYSSNAELNKYIAHDKRTKKSDFKAHNPMKIICAEEKQNSIEPIESNTKDTFNNLLKEIVNTVERKKSGRCIVNAISKSKNGDACTFWKVSDNDTDFRQLRHIFKTVKRTYKKQIKREVKKMSNYREFCELSIEKHSINIGQHLCQIYLKCFSKLDQTPYSQNDFINIRKVVDFFINYLVFKYKYMHAHKNVTMENVVYSVYAKISQHHFRLKHHLRTTMDADPQNDPWPNIVYNQLTKFNIMVNNKSMSNSNFKQSSTKLRQSCSMHSEHSLKYFAIDYFLKLLKTIVIEARDMKKSHVETTTTVSGRGTTSSYNSHHFCAYQSGTNLISPSSKLKQIQDDHVEVAHAMEGDDCQKNSTETDIESVENTPRDITHKFKHKKYKKRRIRRFSFIEKQINKKRAKDNIPRLDLNKFEVNRKVFSKTIRENVSKKSLLPSNTILENTNTFPNKGLKESVNNVHNEASKHGEAHVYCEKEPTIEVYNVQELFQPSRPPTPPPLPLKKRVDEHKKPNLNQVSNIAKEELKRSETVMIPVNMIKNPHKEQMGKKKVFKPKGIDVVGKTNNSIYNHDDKIGVRCHENRSISCENRKHKVISNKINQKIMELTKNLSMEFPKPIILSSDKFLENNVGQTKAENEINMKTLAKKLSTENNSTVKLEIESNKSSSKNHKEKEIVKKEELKGSPLRDKPSLSKQKTSTISNDELFFTNRRKLSIFNRPFHSIFDSDLLSDIKGSDDDFSIHELYFKKPYHRQESNSLTGHLNLENVEGTENSEQKRNSALDSKDKNLTKKQLEVFDELRTMFQENLSSADVSKMSQAQDKSPHHLEGYRNHFVHERVRNNQTSSSTPREKKSRSHSCSFRNGSYSSLKTSRSSEILLQTN